MIIIQVMTNKIEIWKDIIWYKWLYRINNAWLIQSNRSWIWRERKNQSHKTWYLCVNLKKKWKEKRYLIHRLVAKCFIKNPQNKPQINHKNWIRTDNRVCNLERSTNWENQKHAYKYLWKKPLAINLWKFWKHHPNSKKVIQKDLEWNVLKFWDSIADIKREFWYNISHIWECCRWKLKTSRWYKREYFKL